MVEETATTNQTQTRIGKSFFMILSKAGPNRDLSKGSREQAFWDEHAEFIDGLVDDGFITLGGPFEDEGGAVLVVRAADEAEVRERMKPDPWYRNGLLELVSVKRWTVFIDQSY
ncbi:MAG: YciI family protein [Nitrolancea sp.]